MTTPIHVFFPGASLMDIRRVAGGVEVHCPGCDTTQLFQGLDEPGTMRQDAFGHAGDCPVHMYIMYIEAAIQQYERGSREVD